MRIGGFKKFEGPNIHNHAPVLVMKLYLDDLAETSSAQLPGFNQRLLEALPALYEHRCSEGHPGGFVERLNEGTYLGHIVEHMALAMSDQVGISVGYGKTRAADEPGVYNVVVQYKNAAGMQYLLETAVEMAHALIAGQPFALAERLKTAHKLIAHTDLGPSTRGVVEAAERRGIPWQRLTDDNLIQFGYGQYRKLIMAAMADTSSAVSIDIVKDKQLTKNLLERFSIPVPHGSVVETEEEAVAAWREIGGPVVVKPLDGAQGIGVSLNLNTEGQVCEAFCLASESSGSVIVEELLEGKNYRVLVVGGKVVAASDRLAAQVTGDGVHTIRDLVEIANQDPRRGSGHDMPLTCIPIDSIVMAHLAKTGLALESVPEAGQPVFLRESGNLSTGGTAVDVTDEVHPETVRMCERAARIVGLDICGIDLVTADIRRPIVKGGIIELNASPGLRMHLFPGAGQARAVGDAIVNMLYPPGAPSRIPIVAITGTNGKTTVTRMIAHIMSETGHLTGMTTTDGVYIDRVQITHGDHTGPRSARIVLSDPAVQVAVLETARGGIVRSGLGYDWSDVGVITNIQPDHIGQDGIKDVGDLIYIKSLVAERVRENGTLVLNADDQNVMELAEHPRANKVRRKVVLFSMARDNVRLQQHRAAGGTAFFYDDGWIVEAIGSTEFRVVAGATLPATMQGTALFNVSNALAATAACRALDVARECIARALVSFVCASDNRGRANLYAVRHGYVMLDYGHNPHAFGAVAQMAATQRNRRTTGVVSVPGDRADWVIEEAGRVVAQGFDRLIIREDCDLRGRQPGEIAALIERGVRDVKPDCDCTIILGEDEAFARALDEMEENELIVFFYDELEPALEILERAGAAPAPHLDQVAAPELLEPAVAC